VLTDQAELLQEQGVEERDPRALEHRMEMELHTQHGRWGRRRRQGALVGRTEGVPKRQHQIRDGNQRGFSIYLDCD
jgi:hypothetical protein